MKTLLFALNCYLLTLLACLAAAPEAAPVERKGAYDAGAFSIAPLVTYKATEIAKTSGQWGGGLALSYALVNNIEIEVSAVSYGLTDSPVVDSFDEGAVNFKGYLPLGRSGWAPFGLLGYTRDHANDANLMNAGAGLAYRYKRVQAFVQGQYGQAFVSRGNEFRFGAGLGLTF